MDERGQRIAATLFRKGRKRPLRKGSSLVSILVLGSGILLLKRYKPSSKKGDGLYMETDFSEKTITIGKGRKKITLNEMQVVLLAKNLNRQVRLLFGK